jgi:hypothetical protein
MSSKSSKSSKKSKTSTKAQNQLSNSITNTSDINEMPTAGYPPIMIISNKSPITQENKGIKTTSRIAGIADILNLK